MPLKRRSTSSPVREEPPTKKSAPSPSKDKAGAAEAKRKQAEAAAGVRTRIARGKAPEDKDLSLSGEQLALLRSADDEMKLQVKTCNVMKEALAEILERKLRGEKLKVISDPPSDPAVQAVTGNFFVLKQLNRHDKFRTKARRDSVTEEKQCVDMRQLQLLNLLDEVTHLKKEEQRCLKFRSADEDLELVPLKDFLKDPSVDPALRLFIASSQEKGHELRMARLDHELKQRRTIAQSIAETEKLMAELEEASADTRSKLRNINPVADDLFGVMDKLEKALDLMPHETMDQVQLSRYLPSKGHLFDLYRSATGWAELRNGGGGGGDRSGDFEVLIEGGGANEVRMFLDQLKARTSLKSEPDEEEEDVEDLDEEDKKRKMKKKGKHRPGKAATEGGNAGVQKERDINLIPHPLSVVLKLKLDSSLIRSEAVTSFAFLRFFYFPMADVYTVHLSLQNKETDDYSPILNSLYRVSPPAGDLQADRAMTLANIVRENPSKGIPFKWAQDPRFFDDFEDFLHKVSTSVSSMFDLQEEIQTLENLKALLLPSDIYENPSDYGIAPFSSIGTRICHFKASSRPCFLSSLSQSCATLPPDMEELVKEEDVKFFRCELERSGLPARLTAEIAIFDNQSSTPPFFSLSLGASTPPQFQAALRQIERDLNAIFPSLHPPPLNQCLSRTILHLKMAVEALVRSRASDSAVSAASISRDGRIPLRFNPSSRRYEHP